MNQDASTTNDPESGSVSSEAEETVETVPGPASADSKVVATSPAPQPLPTTHELAPQERAPHDPNDHDDGYVKLPAPVRYGLSGLIIGGAIAGYFILMMFAKPVGTKEPTALVPQVQLEKTLAYTGTIDLTVSGTVVPFQEINVAAEVSGRIKKKFPDCLAGNFVKKGTPLITIDSEAYDLALETIKAELNQAEKRLSEIDKQIEGEKKNLKLATEDLAIQRREFERSKRLGSAISRSELDQARRSVNAAQIQATARQNTIATLEASRVTQEAARDLVMQRRESAKLDLRRTKILAPVDGVIVNESVQQDDYVRQGELVLTIENTEVAEVRCNLTTSDLDWIRANSADSADSDTQSIYQLPKTDVTIFDADEPDVKWRGTLERFSGIGRDPVTKTIPCRIIVREPVVQAAAGPRALVRGMYVKCSIEMKTGAAESGIGLVSFNEKALQPNNDVWFVRNNLLYKSTVKVVDRIVKTDPETGIDQVTIIASVNRGDLKPGDDIVVSPLSQPTVGTEITIYTPGKSDESPSEDADAGDADSDEADMTKAE